MYDICHRKFYFKVYILNLWSVKSPFSYFIYSKFIASPAFLSHCLFAGKWIQLYPLAVAWLSLAKAWQTLLHHFSPSEPPPSECSPCRWEDLWRKEQGMSWCPARTRFFLQLRLCARGSLLLPLLSSTPDLPQIVKMNALKGPPPAEPK